jgi:uncharacterized phiE125 gp8 family phage protein
MLDPVRVGAPALSPIDLLDVRAHLRIDHTDEDPLLQLYIDAATGYLEGPNGILGRVLATQSWRQSYSQFSDPLRLPGDLTPVQSVTTLSYYDADAAAQTMSPNLYRLVTTGALGPYIERTTADPWPATAARDDAVMVEFVAGEAPVPAPIRQAMLLLVGHWYDNREPVSVGNIAAELPLGVYTLLINQARIRL